MREASRKWQVETDGYEGGLKKMAGRDRRI